MGGSSAHVPPPLLLPPTFWGIPVFRFPFPALLLLCSRALCGACAVCACVSSPTYPTLTLLRSSISASPLCCCVLVLLSFVSSSLMWQLFNHVPPPSPFAKQGKPKRDYIKSSIDVVPPTHPPPALSPHLSTSIHVCVCVCVCVPLPRPHTSHQTVS